MQSEVSKVKQSETKERSEKQSNTKPSQVKLSQVKQSQAKPSKNIMFSFRILYGFIFGFVQISHIHCQISHVIEKFRMYIV